LNIYDVLFSGDTADLVHPSPFSPQIMFSKHSFALYCVLKEYDPCISQLCIRMANFVDNGTGVESF
jgi:hypothetical protein